MAVSSDHLATVPRSPAPLFSWETISRLWLVLLRYELLLARRSRLGLTVLIVCCLAGVIAGGSAGLSPSIAAYRAWRLGSLLLGFLALPLMALAARRDDVSRASDGVESRPQPAATRTLLRFLGSLSFILLTYAAMILCAWLAQLLLGGRLPEGSGPRFSLLAPAHAFIYGLIPLLFVSALAFLVSTLSPNMLAVAMVGVYWVLVLLGRDYVSRIFDFSLTQNARPYLVLSFSLLLMSLQIARWRARETGLWQGQLGLPAVLLLLLGVSLAHGLVRTRHDPPFHSHPLAIAMAGQNIRERMLPGFWLPDQYGQRTGLHDLAPGPFLVGFWSPMDRDSLALLPAMQQLHERFGSRGLRVIAICLADDWSMARRIARERGYTFPMLHDTGTHWTSKPEDSSPLAEAYEATSLPSVILGDRQRRVRAEVDYAFGSLTWNDLTAKVEALLNEPGQGEGADG